MSRIPEIDVDSLNDEQRAVLDEITSGPHGRVVGPFPAWLQTPELARRARGLSEFVRFKASLPKPLSELAILITGRHWKAEFEFWAHARLGREAGLDEELIRAIAERRRPAFSNTEQEIVYDLITELYETRRVADATHARAVEAFGLPAVVELVATAGYYSLVSMTLNAFAVGLPEGESSPFPD
jgi:4-carboxymuconolactone decarboxylase